MKGAEAGHARGLVVGLRDLGVATVYEAAGAKGARRRAPRAGGRGKPAAGPARTVLCGQGDNLAVHQALARVRPGRCW